jgi:hypothetical protein
VSRPQPDKTWQWLAKRFPRGWEWLREGFVQLSLATLWQGRRKAAEAEVAARIDRVVLKPFLQDEWLPGVRKASALLAERMGDGVKPEQVVEHVWLVANAFIKRWLEKTSDDPEGLPGQLNEAETAELLERSLADSFQSSGEEVFESMPEFVFEEGFCEHREAAWLNQAHALREWQAVQPLLAADPWKDRCAHLSRQIQIRNEVGSWKGLSWLVNFQSPADFSLFEAVGEVLAAAPGRSAAVAPATTVEVLGLALPADWPPRLLVESGVLSLLPSNGSPWKQHLPKGESGCDSRARQRLDEKVQAAAQVVLDTLGSQLGVERQPVAARGSPDPRGPARKPPAPPPDAGLQKEKLKQTLELVAWARLPPWSGDTPFDKWLLAWQNMVVKLLAGGDADAPEERQAKLDDGMDKFRKMLASPEGHKWFDEKLVRGALRDVSGPEARWLQHFLANKWCQCFPEPNLSAAPIVCTWPGPAGSLLDAEQILLWVDEKGGKEPCLTGNPDKVKQFAPSPRKASCVLRLVVAHLCREQLFSLQTAILKASKAPGLQKGWHTFLKGFASWHLNRGKTGESTSLATPERELLEPLAFLTQNSAQREFLETVFPPLEQCLRQAPWKIELVPNTLAVLGKKWAEVSEKSFQAEHVRDDPAPRGTILSVVRFGFRSPGPDGGGGRKAVLGVSVGKTIPGIDELSAILEEPTLPELYRTLKEALESCRQHLLKEGPQFDDGLMQFYREFHTRIEPGLLERLYGEEDQFKPATRDEGVACKMRDGLRQAMVGIGLEEYRPKSRHEDYDPGTWAKEVENVSSHVGQGNLRGVVQPGWKRGDVVTVKAKARYE